MHNKIVRMLSALLLVVVLLGAFSVTAYATETTVPADEIWEYSVYQGHDAIITAYNGDAETIVVPDTIDGLRVIEISDYVFKDQYNLTAITLPDALQTIGSYAFSGCVKLSSVTLPESLENVGYKAFYDCKALSKITVKSVNLNDFNGLGNTFYNAGKESENGITVEFTEGVTRIPGSFFSCDNDYARVTNVTIGSTVQSIGGHAFNNCFDLSSVTFAANSDLRTIGNYAFSGCVKLSSITLPEKLENVEYKAFYDCKALSKITVKSVNLNDFNGLGNTFYNAGKESENGITVEFTEGVTRIPGSFFSCDNDYARVTNVTIGSTVQSIGGHAFNNCSDLSSVTFAANSDLRTIGSNAFSGCVKLSSITLPENLESVGYKAFYDCKALSKITVKSVNLKDFDGLGNTFYNAGKESANGITVEFTEGVTRIPAYFFTGSSEYYARVSNVTVGSSVTEVGSKAFDACPVLNEIDFTGAAPTIASNAFNSVTATAYYPVCKNWPSSVLSNYGGNITWIAKDHPYEETVTPPSCEEEGYTTYTCACGETYKDNIVPPTGHTEVTDPGKDSTCIETGLTEGKHCSVCNTVLIEQEIVPALGHDWNEGEVTQEPTEETEGIKTFTCTRCETVKTETIPILEPVDPPHTTHTYTEEVTPPSCEEEGYTTYTCTCGETYTDNTVPALSHDWNEGEVTQEPTANTEGIKTFTCTRCEATKTEPIPPVPDPNPDPDPELSDWEYTVQDNCVIIDKYIGEDTHVIVPDTIEGLTVTEIKSEAFYRNDIIISVELPEGITCIDNSAFCGCHNLSEIHIPNGVTTIDTCAFMYCESLTRVFLPKSVVYISGFAFDGCSSLTDVYYGGTEQDRQNLDISTLWQGNSSLENASWHYNSSGIESTEPQPSDPQPTEPDTMTAPTDLEWGYDYVADTAIPGTISWKTGDSEQNYFYTDLYRVGDSEPYSSDAWVTTFPLDSGWNSSWVIPSLDLESGTYYFTVTAVNEENTDDRSETVTSDTWTYTRPDAQIGTYQDIWWGYSEYLGGLAHVIDGIPEYREYIRGKEYGYFYAPSLDVEPEYICSWLNLYDYPGSDYAYMTRDEAIETYGDGYYYYAVRALSADITVVRNGEWSEYSNALQCVNGELVAIQPEDPDVPEEQSPVSGSWTTDFTFAAADLGVSAPDSVIRATLTFGEDGTASATWEAVDLTAMRLYFHDMFVNAYYALAYGMGITDLNEVEQYCMDSTGMSVSAYMDTIVTEEAIAAAFTPAPTTGTYTYNQDHTAIFTDLTILGVESDPTIENSFVVGNDTLYLNAASYGKSDYTFVCTAK